jgi:hypothetical protein
VLTSTDYLMAWSIYLLSAAALLLTAWRITRPFWIWLKDPLRILSAVLLLMPTEVDPEKGYYAPAAFVVAFELLSVQGGGTAALIGVRLLLVSLAAILAVWILRLLWYWLLGSRKRKPGYGARTAAARGKQRAAGAGAAHGPLS